jgi:opacity protein-like surface antigen
MKSPASLLAASVLAIAAIGPAQAADISAPPEPLSLAGDIAGFFSNSFDANNNGNTFADRFTFTVGALPSTLDAFVGSFSIGGGGSGLDISGLGVYSVANGLVFSGNALNSGALDLWQLSGGALQAGDYYLQVDGTVVSDDAGSYAGAVLLTPVPEPATMGMLVGGLGLLGLAARRRRSQHSVRCAAS